MINTLNKVIVNSVRTKLLSMISMSAHECVRKFMKLKTAGLQADTTEHKSRFMSLKYKINLNTSFSTSSWLISNCYYCAVIVMIHCAREHPFLVISFLFGGFFFFPEKLTLLSVKWLCLIQVKNWKSPACFVEISSSLLTYWGMTVKKINWRWCYPEKLLYKNSITKSERFLI